MDKKWEKYSTKLEKRAKSQKFDAETIKEILDYAHKLHEKNLPIIFDQHHLSLLVGYHITYLIRASYNPEKFYRKFNIPKKSGGLRSISEPLPSLKEIQKWILDEILYKCDVSEYTKAYRPGKSIKNNAQFHRNQKIVLKLDIKDYFPSIKYPKIYAFFKRLGYSKAVTTMLANLCCLHKCLPQGAPTSPALSNLVTVHLDNRISGFTKKLKIRYTRYADDLTFSGDFNPGIIINFVEKVLNEEGFLLNKEKINTMYQNKRQQVTGIVVNKYMQTPRELRKKLRQDIYYIEKFGLKSHMEKIKEERTYYINHLLGIANHIYFINPTDKEAKKYIDILKKHLNS